jgi:ketosteroid isomerase-like protein
MQLLSNPVKILSCLVGPILLLCTAATLSAEEGVPIGNAKSLAAAEMAFARESLEQGTRAAFLHALSDEGILFQPGPQNGKKSWETKPATGGGVLQWQPVLVATATNGDLGFTTGPWSFKESAAAREATAFGQFVSIWRRENGQWKLLFDIGSENPRPTAPAPELQLVENHAPNESPVTALASMLALDRSYAADRAGKFSSVAEESIRYYPPGEFPILGQSAAAAALRATGKPIAFGEAKGEVSHGGDFGVAWGEYTADADPGYYLRIWRKERGGEWKLALELLHRR